MLSKILCNRPEIEVNHTKGSLSVPDLGTTLRRIMSAADSGFKATARRKWTVLHKGVRIGAVTVADKAPK